MSEDDMIKCIICFILGWLISRMMGNGFSVGGIIRHPHDPNPHYQDLEPEPPTTSWGPADDLEGVLPGTTLTATRLKPKYYYNHKYILVYNIHSYLIY